MKSKPTSNWATLLSEEVAGRERLPTGKGWATATEIANEEGQSIHMVKRRLSLILQRGAVEMFRGTQAKDGRLNNQVWYRIKKGAK
jgi:hypothetical protein